MKKHLLTHLSLVVMKKNRYLLGFALSLSAASNVNAILTFTFTEVGSDVVLTTSDGDSINTDGLSFIDKYPVSFNWSSETGDGVGATAMTVSNSADRYSIITGSSFPPPYYDNLTDTNDLVAFSVAPNAGAGFFMTPSDLILYLPSDYVSGTQISAGSATFTGTSFAALGLIEGVTAVYNLPSDTVIVTVVPEPGSWATILGLTGLAGLVTHRHFRKRTNTKASTV